ncbi:hypothetical protein [Edwardsiella tarda]|uniref:pPIWI-associating nuclease domain-containing protein n=1 Tax=Edwardsiella tarda TaxID=636 RepID=UPI00083A697B|nr:hypothetical protein [Edwardsiella tarda]
MKLKKLYNFSFVKEFEKHLVTDFERELFYASLRNYASHGNPLRFNNFSFSFRALIDIILKRKSPDEKVMKAAWYEQISEERDVTRKQTLKYCAQGGISDEYLGQEYTEILDENISEMIPLYRELSKFTHITEKSLHPNPKEFFENVKCLIEVATEILNSIERCQEEVISTLEEKIRQSVTDMSVYCDSGALSEIASHAYINYTETERIEITSIDDDYIYMSVDGTAYVTQEYGPSRDGVSFDEEYPFSLSLRSHIESPETLEVVSDELELDTSSWYISGEDEWRVSEVEREQEIYVTSDDSISEF